MSLTETIVGVGIFSVVIALVMAAMVTSFQTWNQTASQSATEEVLFKAHNLLFRDLTNTAPDQVGTSLGLSTISGSPDSDALWFLSFIDPATGEPVYGDGSGLGERGAPVWQRNILYYAVVPGDHDALVGQSCTGAGGTDGYEDHCPHKVLIRKVIDHTDDPVTGNEQLLTSAAAYLDRPSGLDTSSMTGEEVRIVGINILHFRATPIMPGFTITMRANSIDEARKRISVGAVPLSDQPTTIERLYTVWPKNSREDAP
jgi:hypothetical protein